MFKVYDEVWIMENNRPTKKIVFAVVESMAHYGRGTETHLQLVNGRCGAGWGNNEGVRRDVADVFTDKDEVIRSLAAA